MKNIYIFGILAVLMISAISIFIFYIIKYRTTKNTRESTDKNIQSEIQVAKTEEKKTQNQEAENNENDFLNKTNYKIDTSINNITEKGESVLNESLSPNQDKTSNDDSDSDEAPLSTINDILDIEKLETDNTELEAKEFQLEKSNEKIVKIETDDKKILIAEDNPINMNVITRMINSIGDYTLILAKNGSEAVELFEKEKPSLIFMDIQMPVMNGFEAYEKISQLTKKENIQKPRVIAMTAYAMEKDKEKCLNLGMDAYIPKPFKRDDILDILK